MQPSHPTAERRRPVALVVTAAIFPMILACGLADADTNSLSISVDASPTTLDVGSSVVVRTQATGQSLLRTVVEYGDGNADTIETVGSEQNLTLPGHVYTQAGTRTIRATAVDAFLGELFDEVSVTVQDTVSNP